MAEGSTQAPVAQVSIQQPASAPNPLMNLEYWGPFLALVISAILAVGFFHKSIKDKIAEYREVHKRDHDALDKEVADLKHDLKNAETTVMAVAANRTSDVERIVKLEIGQQNIEKGQARIEATMDKNHKETLDQMKAWADQFSESIREVRKVAPKP